MIRPPIIAGGWDAEPCDATCPATALVYVERDGMNLAFCGRCFDIRWADLFTNGWRVRQDLRAQLRAAEDNR